MRVFLIGGKLFWSIQTSIVDFLIFRAKKFISGRNLHSFISNGSGSFQSIRRRRYLRYRSRSRPLPPRPCWRESLEPAHAVNRTKNRLSVVHGTGKKKGEGAVLFWIAHASYSSLKHYLLITVYLEEGFRPSSSLFLSSSLNPLRLFSISRSFPSLFRFRAFSLSRTHSHIYTQTPIEN